MKINYISMTISTLLLAVTFLKAQNTYVPDDNFEQALIALGYDSGDLNDSVPTANIHSVTSLDVNGKNIANLEGIENFVSLLDLNCGNNKIASLDMSFNQLLVKLTCFNNHLTGLLNLNSNVNLAELTCYNNQLNELNLSAVSSVIRLNCSNNLISDLDLCTNASLMYVNCSNNKLKSLNLKNGNNINMTGGNYWETGIDSRNNPDLFCIQVDDVENSASYNSWFKDPWSEYNEDCSAFEVVMAYVPDDNFEQALIYLGYDSGPLNDSVPTTSIKNVENLYIDYQNIYNLTGIEHFTSLKKLYCAGNKIQSLNLSINTNLLSLDCSNNLLTQLDLYSNTTLQTLNCGHNKLIDLDLSSNSNLSYINCYHNELTGLNVRNGNNINLQLDARYNPDLLCIQVDDASGSYNWNKNAYTAYSENCSGYVAEMTYVPDDNFEQALIDLGLDAGVLNDSVPTIAVENLKSLNISYKNITDLTGIEDFVVLEQLYCYSNQISEINLTTNTNLKTLQIYNNKLSDLDLSSNLFLTSLNASSNQLTGLNLRNGNNANMSVNVQHNPDLLCIQVDDPVASYEYTNWYKNAYTGYSEDCSGYIVEMTYVPDDNFEQALINRGLDFGPLNDSVPIIGIKSLINLDVSNSSIYDLTGIEDFENIEVLNCNLNNIEFLDLSKNTELLELSCYYNKLATFDLQSNLKLTKVDCQSNPLVSINLSNNANLEYLNCAYCQLTNLNIQNNDKLITFSAQKNPPLCILVNNIESAESNAQWYIDDWANYSLDCSGHNAEKIYLPDDNFENVLISMGFDFWAPDDSVYKAIAESIISLPVDNNNINSLEGIEFFSSLEELNFNNNDVLTVNLSRNVNLKKVSCLNNSLLSLNLLSNKNLIELDCSKNQLETLIVDSCLELQTLDCANNKLQLINLSNNNNLSFFDERANNFSDIDLSKNIHLQYLNCGFNQLSTLELSNYDSLEILACGSNNLTNLDLAHNVLLRHIYCGDNQITSLDLSINNKLEYLNCENGLLTSLNLQNGNNAILRAIDIMNNPNLYCVQVDDPILSENNSKWDEDQQVVYSEDCSQPFEEMTYVPDDNFERALIDLGYDTWPLDDSVLTAKINTVSSLHIDSRNISDLTGIEDFIALRGLDCCRNQLSALDLSNSTTLIYLYCEDNQINTLNFNTNTALERLYCRGNQLTELEVSNNNNLEVLYCNNNQLSSIDLSDNTALIELNCTDNNLTHLNIKNGNNNNISYFSTTGNKDLFCIQVDDPIASESYPNWEKDSWANYSIDCGTDGPGVPPSEYNSLIDLYHSTQGEDWTINTNWLDSTRSVDTWFGITVEDGHVTQILLNNNNLQNTAFEEIIRLPKLRWLDLGNNKLTGFNFQGTDSLVSLDTFMIYNNQLIFLDLAPAFSTLNYPNYSNQFDYSPQAKIDTTENEIKTAGENFSFEIAEQFVSPNDQFQWYKELSPLEGETNSGIDFFPVSKSDSGTYHLQITNPQVPDLTLYSHYKSLYVKEIKGAGVSLAEYNALVDFYNNLDGENWTKNDNWLDTINHTVGDWFGITVENEHVTDIYFGPFEIYNLNGSIPNSIKNLTKLESLVIVTDKLHGELPAGLYELVNLKTLYLSECNISGALSPAIGNLVNLERLGFEANNLEGPIPEEIGNLSRLNFLALQENHLNGELPFSLGELTNLEYLGLSANNLSGTIPSSIGNLINIKWILLDDNQITGPLPVALSNLENAIKINIDNNLIGYIDTTSKSSLFKSIVTENNRQIPDELSSLLLVDTLHLEGNQLQFNDIEAIFSWENFESFNEFIYSPQDSIGVSATEQAFTGDCISLAIDNYFAGPSDRYQWYKNGSSIPGATSALLNLNALQISDAGKYYCKVTNLVATGLTLYSRKITVKVSEGIKGAGVPLSEYEALVAIYNSTNGLGWTNHKNWMDTVNHSVSEWFGITVENGKVTALNLSGLNLEGDVSSYFFRFDSLRRLDLSNNNLSGEFPGNEAANNSTVKSNGSDNQILQYLNISNNNFVFAELEPAFDFFQTIDTFIYAPQSMVGLPFDTTIYKNQPVTFEIANYKPGSFDRYSWSKDGAEIAGADELTFVIQNAALADSGYYTCTITNLLFPELTLLSDISRLNVLIPVGIDDFNNAHFNIYPNPAEKQIFVETGNKPVNLKLFDIAGTLFLEEKDFTSGWINIEPFTRGIYMVRITKQNSETITKKLIFK